MQACPGDHRGHLRRDKKLPRPGAKEELGAPRAVQPPAKHRGKGKADKGHGNENRRKIAIDGSKRLRRQLHAHVSAVGNRHAADENDQRRQCAHEDGIEKNLHNAHQALFRRVGNLRRSVGDGRGTHPRLIGKHPAAASDAKRLIGRTQSPACHRPGRKCPRRDRRERRRNLPPAQHQHHRAEQDICNGDERHQPLGHNTDASRAPKEHRAHQCGQNQSHHKVSKSGLFPTEAGHHIVYAGDHSVDLSGVSHAEGRNHAEHAVSDGHRCKFRLQALSDHIHGAADPPCRGFHPVAKRQRDLRVFRDHPENAANPHPENGPRPAETDGTGNADDISRPYGRRQRRTQRLKGRHPVPAFLPRAKHGKKAPPCSGKQRQLGEAKPQAQIKSHANDQHQRGRTPDDSIQAVNVFGHFVLLAYHFFVETAREKSEK